MKFIFTFDLEDNRPRNNYPKRYHIVTREILRFLVEYGVVGTFFVVGEVAKDCPELIKEVAAHGHEIAFHSHDHTPLIYETPKNFKCQTEYYKKYLEDLTSQGVVGYRAPIFSLTPQTLWASEILLEIGFKYSSSILPAKNPLFGFPDAPREPFMYPSGLAELPIYLLDFGLIKLPLGGIYLRYLPLFVVKSILKKTNSNIISGYCHPYDFDTKETFFVFKNTNFIISLLLWMNRSSTYGKFKHLFQDKPNERMIDWLNSIKITKMFPEIKSAKDIV